jgi:UDP-3-O-[3-hydroxymyristoyl] glucosamine N-acyltransferase
MNFKISEIIDILKKFNYNFEILNKETDNNDIYYKLASVKNIIEKGLYYLTEKYMDQSLNIFNSLIITDTDNLTNLSNVYIKVDNPQLVHYKIALTVEEEFVPDIHPTAIIDKEAIIDSSALIGPYCIIRKCIIGEKVKLLGHITINDNVIIKSNTVIEGNSVIGARGMAWIWDENGDRIMQPQLGGVIIEEDCIIGTDITIVRGSLTENTFIGRGTIIAHGTKIGHGCQIGKEVHVANNVSLAGNAQIGERVFLGSGCVVSSNVHIPEGCIVGAGSVVHKSVVESYVSIAGVPGKIVKNNNFENKPSGAPKPFKK